MIGPFRRRKALRGGIATAGLMAVAAIWIGAGIFYGLPQELDPDEQMFRTWARSPQTDPSRNGAQDFHGRSVEHAERSDSLTMKINPSGIGIIKILSPMTVWSMFTDDVKVCGFRERVL